MNINPIENKVFGAVVTDIRLPDLSDDEFSEINAAFLEYGFLLFSGQFLTDEENVAFGERFGELEFAANPMSNSEKEEGGSFGKIFDIESQRMRMNLGNEAWHTDSTYKPISSKCAMLSAVKAPEKGGETELADARAAYAALDQEIKDRIEDLSAYHSNQFSQANDIGDFPPEDKDTIYHGEAYLRPLVKKHPETGVKNIFVARHAFGIQGLPREESRALLKSLLEFVPADESRVYSHKWQVGDTLFWDNRCLLHRAIPYDYTNEARVLLGTRVAGEMESELAYYPTDPEAQTGRDALAAELAILSEEVKDRRYGATTAAFAEFR